MMIGRGVHASCQPRVIVLGGGVAGLRCAQQLVRKHGFATDQLVLLEASTRIGGRINTHKSFIEGFSLDVGAELIHGDQTSLYRLAKEKGWDMEEIISLAQGDGGPLPADSNNGWGFFYVGGEQRMLAMDSKDPAFVHLNDYLGSLADLWPAMKLQEAKATLKLEQENDSSVTSATESSSSSSSDESTVAAAATTTAESIAPQQLQRSLSMRDGLESAGVGQSMMGIADAGYANTAGAALEDMSLASTCYLEHVWDVDGDRTFTLKGSLGLVVDELSAGLESCIRTSWPVASVDYDKSGIEGVTVTCRDGRIERGSHVVSALPLSVLQDGDVNFTPPLPEAKVTAFGRMKMCSAVKVILKFDRPVFPPLLHGCICSESFIPEFWFRHIPGLPEGGYTMLAVGFAAGPSADAVSALKPEEALERALGQLDDMCRGRKWLEGGGCTGKGDWEEAAVKRNAGPQDDEADSSDADTQGRVGEAGDDQVRRHRQPLADEAEHETEGERGEETRKQPQEVDPELVEPQSAAAAAAAAAAAGDEARITPGLFEHVHCGGSPRRAPTHGASGEGGIDIEGRKCEGTEAEPPSSAYVGGLVHDWVKDEPFVRGGYCCPRAGFDDTTHAEAAASVNGVLFFAGEHTNTPTGMTVHAAIDSGDRAAAEVSRAA